MGTVSAVAVAWKGPKGMADSPATTDGSRPWLSDFVGGKFSEFSPADVENCR